MSEEEGRPKRSCKTYRPFYRKWPTVARKGTGWLMVVELMGLIPMLVIFGIAQPDLYRTDMWRIGWDNHLNSNPNMILYAYANHRPLPNVPLIWSRKLTDFNVAISIISLFFLLSKLILFIMKLWYPIASTFINVSLVALYTVSVYGQVGPDYADKRYPAPAAWYFRFGCDLAKPSGHYSSCRIAQSSLFITLYMLVIYLINVGFSTWAMWPNPVNDVADNDSHDDDDYRGSAQTDPKDTGNWEMQGMASPSARGAIPYTPRTQAFHILDRKLPLRQQQEEPLRYG